MASIIKYHPFNILTKDLIDFLGSDGLGGRLVMDVGCGSGLLAESLEKFGIVNRHGLDLSDEMLDLAREKKLYEKYFNGE